MPDWRPARALISVSDKNGIVEFAQALSHRGVEILSTGGTCRCSAKKASTSSRSRITPAFPK